MGRKKAAHKSRSGTLFLAASVIILEISAGFVWFDVFASEAQVEVPLPIEAPSVPVTAATVADRNEKPVWLKIPRIKVDAAIESVGITPKGAIGIPKYPDDAAWYNGGPVPGEKGSAIIIGHLNWYYGASGVFADLNKLKIGDRILVQKNNSETISFVVREKRIYKASENATDVFSSGDAKSHLNLVTCDGVWNKRTRQYSKRLVVFADKEIIN